MDALYKQTNKQFIVAGKIIHSSPIGYSSFLTFLSIILLNQRLNNKGIIYSLLDFGF